MYTLGWWKIIKKSPRVGSSEFWVLWSYSLWWHVRCTMNSCSCDGGDCFLHVRWHYSSLFQSGWSLLLLIRYGPNPLHVVLKVLTYSISCSSVVLDMWGIVHTWDKTSSYYLLNSEWKRHPSSYCSCNLGQFSAIAYANCCWDWNLSMNIYFF